MKTESQLIYAIWVAGCPMYNSIAVIGERCYYCNHLEGGHSKGCLWLEIEERREMYGVGDLV